jgi:hypothetical protein
MSDRLLLFDEIQRTYSGPPDYNESKFKWTARPKSAYLRKIIQQWFDDFHASDKKRERVHREFRLEDDRKHLGAFFEIYLHHLLTRIGFEVMVEPDWTDWSDRPERSEQSKRKPDFLLKGKGETPILIETTCIMPDEIFGPKKKLENRILDEINRRVNSPNFFLFIIINQAPKGGLPPYKKLCEQIERDLEKLDPDEVARRIEESDDPRFEPVPSIPWNHDSWDIRILAFPKKKLGLKGANNRPILGRSYPLSGNSVSQIHSSIDRKYKRYGKYLAKPFLVAINVLDTRFEPDYDIPDALFGTRIPTDGYAEPTQQRIPDGSWYGPRGYQKTRMSGLIVFSGLTIKTIGICFPVLWHHPHAQNPFDPHLWPFDQIFPDCESGEHKTQTGRSAPEILDFDEGIMGNK